MTKSNFSPRYVIGIDLGTTNCALAYIDTEAPDLRPQSLLMEQWDSEGALIRSETLPSFYYIPVKLEWKRGQLALPWDASEAETSPPDYAIGRLARLKSSQTPGRVIHAAKSWLCHSGVDRRERILPWHSDEVIGDERRSPIEVSAAYLTHLRKAWNHTFQRLGPAGQFENQEIVITVPASFDEVAQRLTMEAILLAGYPRERVRLLEEPQAAFYEWLGRHEEVLEKEFGEVNQESQTILVCDVGGGTTDFSLLSVSQGATGRPKIVRIGVSEHILLGGDNIDLGLARILEQKLLGEGRTLTSRQWAQLVAEARSLKERSLDLLSQDSQRDSLKESEFYVSVAGEGGNIFASSLTVGIFPSAIYEHIVEGFFPFVGRDDRPRKQRGGLTQLGLPYAADSAVTKHLAAFLDGRPVNAVLFAGGTVKPLFLRDRVVSQIAAWQGFQPKVLHSDAVDLTVSLGAAQFALSERESFHRLQIKGGYPRSLYVEVASLGDKTKLLCVVPKGFVGGQPLAVKATGLKAMTNRPVRFKLFSSLIRDQDQAGDLVVFDEETFRQLPSLDAKLMSEGPIQGDHLMDVALEVTLQTTGILDVACVATEDDRKGERWLLEFSLKDSGATSPAVAFKPPQSVIETHKIDLARQKLDDFYGKKRRMDSQDGNPKYLLRDLEQLLGKPRDAWDTVFLRSLWPHLEQGLNRRNRSVGHELSWLYLAGFALRPGYGFEMDEWRVKELWRVYDQGLAFPKERQAEEQWWILWRRVAGGLSREQQEQVFARIFPQIRKGDAQSAEVYMLAGSLERIEMGQKVRLGQQLALQISTGKKQHLDQKMWALARIASRVPLYAGPQNIIRPSFIEAWAETLHPLNMSQIPYSRLTHFYAQAGRVTGDREFDLSPDLRRMFLERLIEGKAGDEFIRPVREFVPFKAQDHSVLFGESLPAGLWLGA